MDVQRKAEADADPEVHSAVCCMDFLHQLWCPHVASVLSQSDLPCFTFRYTAKLKDYERILEKEKSLLIFLPYQ